MEFSKFIFPSTINAEKELPRTAILAYKNWNAGWFVADLLVHQVIMVLIFCVEFRELSHLTCDLSQAEKNINVVSS